MLWIGCVCDARGCVGMGDVMLRESLWRCWLSCKVIMLVWWWMPEKRGCVCGDAEKKNRRWESNRVVK